PSAHPVVTGATFTARSPFGAPLLDETMEQMRDAITVRAEHAGMEVLDVSIRTPDQLVLRVAGEQTPAAMAELTSLSYLTFRRVIGRTAGGAVTAAHAATPSPSGTRPSPGPLPQLSEVRTQVGEEAWSAAERLSAPAYPGTVPALSPFADLTPEQVAVLPATIQFNVPTITCAQLNRRPPVPQPRLSRPVVACPADVPEKLLLDATEV